eukprot:1610554-Amphidinium_carterae.1
MVLDNIAGDQECEVEKDTVLLHNKRRMLMKTLQEFAARQSPKGIAHNSSRYQLKLMFTHRALAT